MNPFLLLPLIPLLAAPASASPVTVTCKIPDKARVLVHELTLDEANQTVTRLVPSSGAVDRFPGLFTSTAVSWTWVLAGIPLRYSLSRETGQLFSMNKKPLEPYGTCTKKAPTKRLF